MPGDDVGFMRALDDEYRRISGLTERRYYSIFYSRVAPSPLMILGINPGGDPGSWTMPAGADEFCSAWQHDYVDERYPIQAAMLPLLQTTLGIDTDVVRRIPKTNMVFRRSSREDLFENQQGMRMAAALLESAPILERIIRRVSPRTIIFEGMGAMTRFAKIFGDGPVGPSLVPAVTTPNGRHPALIYSVHDFSITILPHPITAIVLAYPSKYAARAEFATARSDMGQRLAGIGAELRAMGKPNR